MASWVEPQPGRDWDCVDSFCVASFLRHSTLQTSSTHTVIVPIEHHVEWIAGCIAYSGWGSVFVPSGFPAARVQNRVEVANTGTGGSVLSA